MTVTASFTVPEMDCSWKDYYPETDRGKYIKCLWQADPRSPASMNVSSLADIVWEVMPATGWSVNLWDGSLWDWFLRPEFGPETHPF